MLQQVLVQEQVGPCDERPRLDGEHAAAVVPARRHRPSARALGHPGRTRARPSSATRSPRRAPAQTSTPSAATARRDGDELRPRRRQVARHVVQRRHLRLLPGQADRRPARRRARDVHRRPAVAWRPRRAHARVLPHHRPPPPDRRLRGRAGTRLPPRGRGGGRDGVRVRVVPFRKGDGRGALPRCRRAADRGGDRPSPKSVSCTARRSSTTSSSRRCSPTA